MSAEPADSAVQPIPDYVAHLPALRGLPKRAVRRYRTQRYTVTLVREPGAPIDGGSHCRNAEEAARIAAANIGDLDREVFMVLMLNVRHRLIGINLVSVGCATSSLIHPREVFKPAILAGATNVIVAHNHPSGNPEPSAEDLAVSRRLSAAGQLLGIEVLDHVITTVPEGRFVSLKLRGVL